MSFDRGLPSSAVGIRIVRNLRPVMIGWASGIRLQESIGQFPIDALGDVFTKQFETTRVRVSGSFDTIRIFRKPLVGTGAWPAQTDTVSMIRKIASELQIYNPISGELLYLIETFSPTDRSITISTDTVMIENCSFVARRMIELEPRFDVDQVTIPAPPVA